MHAVLIFISATITCLMAVTWAAHCGKKAAARMRKLELEQLPRLNPAYYRPLREPKDEARRVKAIITHNEKLIGNGCLLNDSDVAKRLICHPSIWCRYTTAQPFPIPNTAHGIRHAVWRENMDNPVCPACMIEFGAWRVNQHA